MADDKTVAELIEDVTVQTVRLVRRETAAIRQEMLDKADKARTGMILLGGAGVLVAYGTGAVVNAAVTALSRRLPPWAAALAVGGGMISAGGVLAAMGRRELRQAFPLVPRESAERVKTDALQIVEEAIP